MRRPKLDSLELSHKSEEATTVHLDHLITTISLLVLLSHLPSPTRIDFDYVGAGKEHFRTSPATVAGTPMSQM
jgi:hypothetical protein